MNDFHCYVLLSLFSCFRVLVRKMKINKGFLYIFLNIRFINAHKW